MVAITAREWDRGIAVEIVPPEGLIIRVNPARIIAPGSPLSQLRVVFSVEKSLSPDPNRGTVTMFNLKRETRNKIAGITKRVIDFTDALELDILGKKIMTGADVPGPGYIELIHRAASVPLVRVLAGYRGNLGVVFEATAMRAEVRRDGSDWLTTLETTDGGLGAVAVAGKSFSATSSVASILDYLVKELGWAAGQVLSVANPLLPAKIRNTTMQRSHVLYGSALSALTEIMDGLDLDWWVDDGEFWILERDGTLPGVPAVLNSVGGPTAALILDAPRRIEGDALEVRTLLTPTLRIGRRVELQTREFTGSYRCERTRTSGDNRGGRFDVVATLRDLSDGAF